VSAPGKLVRSSRWKTGPSRQRPLGSECCGPLATVVAKRTQRLHGVWVALRTLQGPRVSLLEAVFGTAARTDLCGGREMKLASLPLQRREFVTLIGGAAAAWPLAARAQQPGTPVIGFLNSASPRRFANMVDAFREGLNSQGFREGHEFRIEYQWAEGDYNKLPALASELVQRRVALIAATGGIISAQAAINSTSTIPILFVSGIDPVVLGMVSSLSRPGGNVTGVSLYTTELASKRLELLKELVPRSSAFALLVKPASEAIDIEIKDMSRAARGFGLELIVLKARTEREIEAAFASAAGQGASAITIGADPFFTSLSDQLVALAARHSLPAVYPFRQYTRAEGLMSYGTELTWAYRQIGVYAGRILKGDKPADLPVQLPTKFNLVINLKTAKALGLEIPATLLARADEVIE
jgi:putative ABC transport system substrate-binding protein